MKNSNYILRETEDGSHTLYVPVIDETYHSIHGAVNESKHVFIEAGLSLIEKQEIKVLEIGFGTGLNALLVAIYAQNSGKRISYTSIEKYPIEELVWEQLNYGEVLSSTKLFNTLHRVAWGSKAVITPNFSLKKLQADLKSLSLSDQYDCIFFDAFSPEKQAELWTEDIFRYIYTHTADNGVLTTYCAKGAVRRVLQAVGFKVERIPGPVGKREMLRARKIYD